MNAKLHLYLTATEDLSGKVFTFPEKGSTAYVRLIPSVSQTLTSATVCLRFYTDLGSIPTEIVDFVLFSMDTTTQTNSFALFRNVQQDFYSFGINGVFMAFYGMASNSNKWNSLCAIWDVSTGTSQITVNSIRSIKRKIQAGGSIAGTPFIVLGQDQDSYGGGFQASQAFIGDIKDVHMWNHVISPCEIKRYMQGLLHSPGNYLDWSMMNFSAHGYVLVEDDDTC